METGQVNGRRPYLQCVESLTRAVSGSSLRMYVRVYALDLKRVLDRLGVLEAFQEETLAALQSLRGLSNDPKGV